MEKTNFLGKIMFCIGKKKANKARMDLIFDTIHAVGQELVAV